MRVSRAALSRRPLRMTSSLGKPVFAAMAALVLALLSEEPWVLGVEINIRRSILVVVAVLLAANACVVFQQRLYVRGVSLSLSEQAAFFSLTSLLTVFGVFLVAFAPIFALAVLVTPGICPRHIVKDRLGKDEVGILGYVRVSLLIGPLAMVVGAWGAGLEENQHFRQVTCMERGR